MGGCISYFLLFSCLDKYPDDTIFKEYITGLFKYRRNLLVMFYFLSQRYSMIKLARDTVLYSKILLAKRHLGQRFPPELIDILYCQNPPPFIEMKAKSHTALRLTTVYHQTFYLRVGQINLPKNFRIFSIFEYMKLNMFHYRYFFKQSLLSS